MTDRADKEKEMGKDTAEKKPFVLKLTGRMITVPLVQNHSPLDEPATIEGQEDDEVDDGKPDA